MKSENFLSDSEEIEDLYQQYINSCFEVMIQPLICPTVVDYAVQSALNTDNSYLLIPIEYAKKNLDKLSMVPCLNFVYNIIKK